jgi:hypothetical protein
MKTQELTPVMINNFIRNNPGCIQSICYPNPGEPQLDESLFFANGDWNLYCCCCDTYDKDIICSCDEDIMWVFSVPDDMPYNPEGAIGEFLTCRVEDSKIVFETD